MTEMADVQLYTHIYYRSGNITLGPNGAKSDHKMPEWSFALLNTGKIKVISFFEENGNIFVSSDNG